ncbi:MAG: hypothetical protein JO000_24125 [Alphaproteobacteria bacterium]|nr:hypothetical protein [Alphaproteobacteria bacterium]
MQVMVADALAVRRHLLAASPAAAPSGLKYDRSPNDGGWDQEADNKRIAAPKRTRRDFA